jgi:HK97 family phage portal protein
MSVFFRKQGGSEQRSMDWWSSDAEPPGGRSISMETATHLGPVFGAIRHIVDFVSTLPIDGYRKNPDGTTAPLNTLPPLFRNQDRQGEIGTEQFIAQGLFGMIVYGNAVGWITETDAYGFPTMLKWLRRVDWNYDWPNGQWYVYGKPVASSRLLHIPWLVPPGWALGMSPIEHYATIIRAGLSAQEYADVRRGGGLPPSILKNNQLPKLEHDASERIRERAAAAFRTGKPFVTGKDWDFTAVSIPPNHAQFIETLRLTADQIAAIYGIDPREIGGAATDSLTYSTDESKTLNRASNMRPYIERLERAFARILPAQQFVKLNVDATVRADIKTRTDVIGAQIADGRLSVNEARALEDRPAITGGDFHNIPKAVQTPPLPSPAQTEG